ncbi:MAG: hypothetical protein AB7R90_15730 [Reyranellaceae bacterium]
MSLMNPEFRRNLWLELTPARLGVSVLAVVSLLALAGVRDRSAIALSSASEIIFAVAVFFWGGRLAADAVLQEIADRTWDSQRMSALTPWQMSWGKLFGAPVCAWVAAIPALAVMAAIDGVAQAATYVLLGVLCHAIALALSLQSIRKGRQHGRIKTLFFQFVALLVVLPFAYALIWLDRWTERETIYWFALALPIQAFALVSALLFSAWAVLAVYRQMRLELQKPTGPTAWLAFLAFLLLYQTGLVYGGTQYVRQALNEFAGPQALEGGPLSLALVLAGMLLSALVYLAIFTEPKSMIGLRQLGDAWRRGEWRRFWLHTPRWALTLSFAAVATALVVLLVELPAAAKGSEADLDRVAIAAFLFLLRNVGIVLLCNFMARSERGDMAAIVVLIVLSVIAPMIFGNVSPAVAALFWPPLEGGWAMSLVPVGAQLVLVGGLLARVWMQAEKERNRPV